MLKVVQIDIPDDIVVPCPKFGFDVKRAAKHCPICEHFNGVGQMSEEGEWHQRYAIRCAHIIERRTVSID